MRLLEYLEEGLITFLMAAMTLITFMQVIGRYVFNYNFVWSLELTGVMFAWLIFIGMSYGVRVGAHIGVDALVKSLGSTAARVVGSLAAALCILYALLVAFGSFQYVQKMYDVGILMQDMPVQSWIPRAILPVGFLLLAFRFSQVLWRLATGQDAHLLGDEAKEALKLRQDEPDGEVQK
ncbi:MULTISPECIES: TRAP transporter small permease [unclassified Polaromonas]|jgi:C4-dicarboxylate transporter DctQ subunit|uniref:TRAP transporter small permease n=1 Tax=unclassified Polaromonas TaxID=2638319 RepID=UPI0018CBE1FC|nr:MULTISPECIES: TRAP transporter small permease [unclassified Polaromonas]MBG6072029.1 C4-dicarboxylate transporter DctQ subunit [Polaromonas sp. CG_9.7]MBG6114032.1 C4-dicarboxylate transporter DctQ subunit [Polaromonas sp. CG_9.2]MDH6184883.1 C4-dicarboxylate transporter DctQ subunit [Polaromonas sp. CG_23.6]